MSLMICIDVGSTTTKAILFQQRDGVWRFKDRSESATTVEAPTTDVMIGVIRALRKLQERSGTMLLNNDPQSNDDGLLLRNLDCQLLVTSSAGGGLQMVVCGHVSRITGESAQRAAMGGGAVLLDVFASDDGRHHFHRLERLRALRPDMVLLSGGVEGSQNVDFMIEMCDFLRVARPKPKFGYQLALPVIYAGTSTALPIVQDLLSDGFILKTVENLRPSFDRENLDPAREAIHELFIEHVMSNAPGYDRLKELATQPILPTPSAVGELLVRYARRRRDNILCCDIGGATTDIFSVVQGRYVRTVSANYGMSYSIGNVASTAGKEAIKRWLPPSISASEAWLSIGSKMLRPVDLPADDSSLCIEQAVAREALRLAYQDHLQLSRISAPQSIFEHELLLQPKEFGMEEIDVIIGSGGALSHAPQRSQAAAILIDALQPQGVTELLVDSVFMLPHLGSFSLLDEANALLILEKDGLIPLGTVIAPRGNANKGQIALRLRGITSQGLTIDIEAKAGEVSCLALPSWETAEVELSVSAGFSWPWRTRFTIRGGICGVILDLRGRPLTNENKESYEAYWKKIQSELSKEEW